MDKKPLLIMLLALIAVAAAANFFFQPSTTTTNLSALALAVLPEKGYATNVVWGDIGPKLIESGAIDLEKFKQIYSYQGGLTQEQLEILTKGSNKKIMINEENAHFVINVLWALGLVNKNKILDEGPMQKYSDGNIGGYASTGGWTLGKKPSTELYSSTEIVVLNEEQQRVVEEVANNVYRPCCNNPTSFPDCNHGMAALALAEIMASQGASADEIFSALKAFNSFWFPQQYYELALYFKLKEGKEWNDVDAETVLGRAYSSASGWFAVHQWLQEKGALPQLQGGGGSCGA